MAILNDEVEVKVHLDLNDVLAQLNKRTIWDFLGTDRESLEALSDFIADLSPWRFDDLNKHLKFYDLEVKHV